MNHKKKKRKKTILRLFKMKKSKKVFLCAVSVSVFSIAIFVMYLLDNTKTWEINFAFYAALFILPLTWILYVLSLLIDRKELHEYTINNYLFKPLEFDLYQDLRILMEEKEMSNSIEEKELLEKYKLLVHDLTKNKDHYLVYKDNIPHALIKYQRNFKNKTVNIETIFLKAHDFEEEIDILLKKEGFQRI